MVFREGCPFPVWFIDVNDPFWNQLNGNNSAIFERIRTKFDTDMENKVPGQLLPSEFNSYPTKSTVTHRQ